MLAITAHQLLTPVEVLDDPLLLVEDGMIREIGTRSSQISRDAREIDFPGALIAPGYIDLHIHGSAGHDVMDSAVDALPAIECLLARHGVTSYYPTTVTAPIDKLLGALERLSDAIESRSQAREQIAGRARPLGIHLEGPFISHARRGVHPPENLLPPTIQAFERFWQASRGHIRMMTIAPELAGADEVIAEATRRGVCVSLGHSDADMASAWRGIEAGARHATHTCNAMRPLDHRDPGILGAVLIDSRVSADMIVDGVHLDPAMVRLLANLKGFDNTVLITDATAATGMPDGRYHLGWFAVDVKDGRCTANGKLAGSVLTMDRAVRNLASFVGWDLSRAVAAATRNPARAAHILSKGVLAPGADADFIVIDRDGTVIRTFIGGVECWKG
jgi:N-acetylglucosamine-6-phosphate deacetylase